MEPTSAAAASSPSAERVGFGPRLGAYLIDQVVIWVVAALAARPLSGPFSRGVAQMMARGASASVSPTASHMIETVARVAIAGSVVSLAYFGIEGLSGRVLGKLVLGLRIARADARRAPLGSLLGRAGIKTGAAWMKLIALGTGSAGLSRASTVLGLVLVGGCLLALWPRRQALHDLVARTAVFHASDVGAADPARGSVPAATA